MTGAASRWRRTAWASWPTRSPSRSALSRASKAQLTKAAATTQGSGWGVLAYEPLSGRLIVEQVYDHQGNVGQGATPILVFDAWEHAFYLQYKNQKVDFIDAMWAVVNWQDVAKRYEAAKSRTNTLLLAP
ncbi:Fe-Mn family superoxide dismutase [Streptomyces thinghirensis]|nr:Fe-Mn family superoxide dismutase [Streptomyces thinghirensis]